MDVGVVFRCESSFPFGAWGEDKYMTNCLEMLGCRSEPWAGKKDTGARLSQRHSNVTWNLLMNFAMNDNICC